MAKLLIVEDYESLQKIYKAVLEQEGHSVEVVNDGLAALEKLKNNQYDLILLDLLLPHMSGIEFLEAFEPAKHPSTRVVVCSNFANDKFTERADEMGVRHHFTKSNLTPKEVADVVAKTLQEP